MLHILLCIKYNLNIAYNSYIVCFFHTNIIFNNFNDTVLACTVVV